MNKLFSLLFVMILTTGAAEIQEDKFRSRVSDQYQLTVIEVDPEEYCFKLSNQLTCNLLNQNLETDILPEIGDSVELHPMLRYYGLGATHIEYGELGVFLNRGIQLPEKPIVVWVSGESACPLFVRSEKSWQAGVYKEVFVLSDGSGWMRKEEEKTLFVSGDRIIVAKGDQDEYHLINLDKSFRFELSDGLKVGTLAYEPVEPFNKSTKE
ncbi:MAG TPA: hypothetical protein VFU89_02135 [Rhabdochlamydiaceae bacterium]|nr:hypothetical protein [Rhabdochlamydiaceae bacterium]